MRHIWTLFGNTPIFKNIVPFDSKHVAMCLRMERVEVTNLSTWGGGTSRLVRFRAEVMAEGNRAKTW
jgi:hypothetical protein